ncbi:hypothetical protein FR943_08815 [Mycobacterium sp. TNTM28]|uniref:Uncharacterized protein n=1 Tax=[Mycobacterium] fortunisiensis TaxID=2600579 RepID=A0ABS6KK48_9MYCO|nr:hypothetical protein [[Mycobacterium] fortunisiensis]MBU9763942.1 hypothetical protein [[Mycobacterium] fortunisiensis]
MSAIQSSTFFDFEIYVLASMKLGMLPKRADIEAKLSEYDLSLEAAESIGGRVVNDLADESSRFTRLKSLVGADPDAISLTCTSLLWPDFDFTAAGDESGLLRSVRYQQVRGGLPTVNDPTAVAPWSTGVSGFEERFGSLTLRDQSLPFEHYLPAHEQYVFPWNGDQYGAGFSWGIFLFAAKLWPED